MPLVSQAKFVASIASGHTAVSTGPTDVCKTPAPPAPAPIHMPYPNVSITATPGPAYCTKTMAFMTPMYTKNSQTALSNGDQPGVAMGLFSSKIMGMASATQASNDVTAEGGAIVRTLDMSDSNG